MMKKKLLLQVLAICVLILSACQSSQSPETEVIVVKDPTNVPLSTETSAPTSTALPTETPNPTKTPLPTGVLFRDDFDGELQPGWTWDNENKERWTITDDGWLQILAEDSSYFFGGYQSNMLFRDLPGGDYEVVLHAYADPNEANQSFNLMLFEDQENFMEICRAFCLPCEKSGSGFITDYKMDGSWGYFQSMTDVKDFYMKIKSQNEVITTYYAIEPDNWVQLGKIGNYYNFKKMGIGVTNSDPENKVNADLIVKIDYVEIREPK